MALLRLTIEWRQHIGHTAGRWRIGIQPCGSWRSPARNAQLSGSAPLDRFHTDIVEHMFERAHNRDAGSLTAHPASGPGNAFLFLRERSYEQPRYRSGSPRLAATHRIKATMLNELLSPLVMLLRRHRWLAVLVASLTLAYAIRKRDPALWHSLTSVAESSRRDIVQHWHWLPVTFVLVAFLSSYILLRKSTREYWEELGRWTTEPFHIESATKEPIETVVVSSFGASGKGRRPRHQVVQIFNRTPNEILQAHGTIVFCRSVWTSGRESTIRTHEVPFRIAHLPPNEGIAVQDETGHTAFDWDSFYTHIAELRAGDITVRDQRLTGVLILRTFPSGLFSSIWFPPFIRTKNQFELSWLRDTWYRKLRVHLLWPFQPHTIVLSGPVPKEIRRKYIFQIMRALLTHVLPALAILAAVVYSFAVFTVVVWHLLTGIARALVVG